jgi:hypothetical protein
LAAKKYEGWVEERIEFFNNQVEELQILCRMATSKTMEEKYLQKKREKMEEKTRGPVKQLYQVSALNGLVAVKEVVVNDSESGVEQQSSIPGVVTYPSGSNKRSRRKLGSGRRISNALEHLSSLSGSYQSGGGGDNHDDDGSSKDPSNGYHREKSLPRNQAPV